MAMDNPDNVMAVMAVLAACVSVFALLESRRALRYQREDAKRQADIALESMLIDYERATLDWANETIDCLSRAESLTYFDPEKMASGAFFDKRAECLWRLSSLMDRGRLFFPNESPEAHGGGKPEAYRGFKPVVLELIDTAHDAVKKLKLQSYEPTAAHEIGLTIVAAKKKFVSAIQIAINPRAREKRLRDLHGHAVVKPLS